MRVIWRTTLCAALAAGLAACGSGSPSEAERDRQIEAAAGVSGFPSDLPVYPQANIVTASPLPNQGYTLQAQASDPIEKVADFYSVQMKANGWTDNSPAETSPVMRMLQYRKGTRTASIHLIPNESGTTVQLQTYVS